MKSVPMNFTFLLIFLAIFPYSAPARVLVECDLVGGARPSNGSPVFIKLHLESTKTGTNGFFHSPGWQIKGRRFSRVSFDERNLHFEFPSQEIGKVYVGEGQLKDGVISGKIQFGEEQSSFHLVRLSKIPAKLYEDYVGAYQIAPDRTALITWGTFGHLRLVDLKSGSKDFLLPSSESTFFLGSSVASSPSVSDTITFVRNQAGSVTSLVARLGGREISAPKDDLYKQELVTFRNGDTALAGILITPATKGPHPAVVYIEGSGDRTRDDACCGNSEIRNVLTRGVAFLLYDKRGTGGSTGDWRTSSFQDLAKDALAGVRLLKARRDINPRQIGLIGSSQGGWIAPLAASQSKDVAFSVSISAAGVPPAEQEKYDQVNRLRMQGLSETDLKKADEFLQLQFDAVRSSEGWEKLQAVVPGAQNQTWSSRSFAGFPKEHWIWTFWRKNVDYDPAHILQKVKCPILLIFGENDPGQPVQKGVARVEKALKDGGNQDYLIKVIPKANHTLQVLDRNNLWVLAPDFESLIADWVLKRVTTTK